MTGRDFGGNEVIAAYQPVSSLGLGITVKIDMAELRAPFIRAGVISSAGAVLIFFFGHDFVPPHFDAAGLKS